MHIFRRRRSPFTRLLAMCSLIAVFGGAAIALADASSGVPNTGGPPPAGHHHGRKLSPAAARKRAALVARKRREGHHHTRAHSATGAIGPGTTFADQGVTLSAASAQSQSYAAGSGLSTTAAAISGFQNLSSAETVFGPTTLASNPTATLLTVTEQDPIVSGVTAGVPYSAWVVSVNGPEIDTGPPAPGATTASSTTATCKDVGIYDVQISKWTELLQNC
jgi:hypothetical protein